LAVDTYRNAESKEQKREMERLIADIKSDFKSEISLNDPKVLKLRKLSGELFTMTNQTQLFEMSKKEKADWNKKVLQLTEETKKLEAEIEEIKANKIFENAFEWRFEFPEVLNDDGDFVGFDVVIGNPPYGVLFSNAMKEYLNSNFEGIQQKMFDSFLFFISMGERLLKQNGIKSFIVPNNLIYQMTFEKARLFLIEKFHLVKVVNLGDKVFEDAEVPTCIYVAIKHKNEDYKFDYCDLRDLTDKGKILNFKDFESIKKSSVLSTYSLVFGVNEKYSNVINKVNNNTVKISEIIENASYGIGSGSDKLFRLKRLFCDANNLEKEILSPVYSGGNINRYYIDYQDELIIYTTKDLMIDKYPNILNHLIPFKAKLSQKRETQKGTLPWWCLHWPRNKELYFGDKIVLRQTGDKIVGAIDNKNHFVMDSVMVIKLKKNINLSLGYLLALLNCQLYNFLYDNISKEKGRAFAQVKPQNIKQLPIKVISTDEQKPFIKIVDKIIEAKEQNPSAETKDLENQIDQLVYQLYDLTEEEIAIVEGSNK
jgi:hypothetical protein